MEVTLQQLDERWAGIEWLMDPYKDTDVPLLKMQEEDFEALEADQLAVQGMMASRYLAQFEAEVTRWQQELATTNDVFLLLQEIQRTWSYLEPLFIHSDEVKRELPEDAVRFAGIDVDVKALLKEAWAARNIKGSCNAEGLVKRLESIQELLDICKKSLADFLDGRRRQFPRYYFTSEADLLDILSNGSNPEKILVHVPKVYLQTKTLVLGAEKTASGRPVTTKFISGVGVEEVVFEPPVPLEGKVEIYMQTVMDGMKLTLFENLKRSLKRYAQLPRPEWLMHKDAETGKPSDPAQIILLVLAVYYVQEAEAALTAAEKGDPQALAAYNTQQIDQLTDLIRLTQSDLTKGERTRVMVCITMDTHGRDIVQKMMRMGVANVNHFQWQSQLKHKFRVPPPHASFKNRDPTLRTPEGERAEIAILNAVLPYDYEYLGNGPRLVITPLTDRIYVTATQALNLKMGCAPAGPAGTGKTESTKDLANALAKCCYVFNCSPEMDYKGLGNIFKGLASSGAWGCFDEFNRLIPEVLSVCSVQFKAVCDGVKAELARIVVEGDEISLDPTCGAYITMNPGYLGRSELPEGLKALFRPMTVMVPDLVLICENMLMSEGFVEAKVLASKFYGLYSLLRELLSKQMHYDWGLRAVKSVLVVAGGFKRAEPELPEGDLLMRALRDFNIPKIVREDEVVFFGLLGDLFPGVDPPRKVDPELEAYVEKGCLELNNHPDEVFKLKVVQLEELAAIRHCVFVMGPPAAGKSQCWRTLIAARNQRNPESKTTFTDINPKSVKTEELYGYISMATREWKDGLLSKIMRDLGQIENEKPKWIMLDGDLDANWIESMNSVMDDNRMLTLASNERIPLKPYMRMIFEIRDLRFATPATVSRAGILYISADDGTQWRSLIESWVAARPEPEETKATLREYFGRYIADALLWMKINVSRVLPLEEMNMVQSLLFMLDGLLTPKNTADPEQLDIVFVFCLIWALGSSLTLADDGTDYRKVFSEYWKGEFKSVKFPSRDTVFDYWLDPENGTFDKWDKSPYFYTIEYESTTPMAQVTVPTPETGSVTFWMQLLVGMSKPIMLAGPAGTGKTQMINGLLQKQNPDEVLSTTINFNFYTTSAVLQNTMFLPLEKKTGTNYGPPGNKRLIYFVDDLNLPEVDVYDTQSAIALLRQKMEYRHVYDLVKMGVRNIANTQVVASMNPTAGSFQINPRLQRNFTTFAIGMPGQTSLLTIYQTFLDGHLKNFEEEVAGLSSALIKAALTLHQLVSQNFRKTAREFHYEFNIRHLSNVFQGLLVAQPDQFKSAEKFVQLWLHESERVYGDRLVSIEDLQKYKGLAQNQAKKTFPSYNVTKFFANEKAEPLVFCHFAENIQDRVYDQVTSLDSMNKILEEALREYNETNAAMDLVLFEDAMKHVARIVRIVLNEGGHALLVGVGGSGKQSLSRLAAFICSYTVVQIVISSTYGINDLRDDLKAMYMKAGVKDEGVMFLLTDSQITNERFLIFINDLLASGNIPDLFAVDEVDGIVNAVTGRVKAAGLVPERKTCWDFFINETRRNLHTVLAFSPVGDDMRNRAKKFPALVNCTVIDWFQPWPKDALFSVGKKFLADVDVGAPEIRAVIEAFLPFSFEKVNDKAKVFLETERRHVYTTPKSYLELLKLYAVLLKQKKEDENAAIKRLSDGLLKLKETKEAVTKIEEDLKVSLEEADQKKTVAEGIAEDVAREKAVVEVETAKAQVEAEQVAKIQAEVSVKQRDTEADLAKAEPAVEAAMGALDTLDKKDLGMCKTMGTPPFGVDDVFAATMVLLAGLYAPVVATKKGVVKDRSWGAAKKQVLGNIPDYMQALKDIKEAVDNGSMPDINLKEVRPYLDMEHFNPEIILTKNSAAAGLCNFVINIVTYRDIVVTVEPKRKALAEANAQLEAANSRLKQVNELVAELEAKLAVLTTELNAANKEKQDALDTVARGQKKLDLAQRLTTALAAENERWAVNVEVLKANRALLTGDVLMATAFISYVGPFTKTYRDELLNSVFGPFLLTEFRKAVGEEGTVPMSETINPLKLITKDADIAVWQQNGLPADQVSTENASIVQASTRWPLMIDPQLQGIAWIRRMEETPERNLQIVRLGQKDILRKLQAALENGWSILIENLGESIDAVLNPVIQRATIRRGKKQYLKLGDTEVEFNPNFRLFLHTKLSNPHYPPEIQAEAALVNFTVTIRGLEDQLLSLVVRKERLDLATLSEFLIEQQNSFKIKILELEDNILHRLATAEGDITEDVDLIEGLEETKRISTDINEKAAKAVETQAQIQITSEKYRPVANRSALLFFMMNDLFKIHSYYIYSLAAFTTVFYRGIDLVTEKSEEEKAEEEKIIATSRAASRRASKAIEGNDLEAAASLAQSMDAASALQSQAESRRVSNVEGGEAPEEDEEDGAEDNKKKELTDEELAARNLVLINSITETVFSYVRRGLFERDKLTVATLMTLSILVNDGKLDEEDVDYLVASKSSMDPGNMGPLQEWLPEVIWPKVKALEGMKRFQNLGDQMQSDSDDWLAWFDNPEAETAKLPGDYQKTLTTFDRLVLLRAMRPDRTSTALSTYIGEMMGQSYILQPPFNMDAAYAETSPETPVFFVLFPGVDPTPWVETLGKKLNITIDNGKFINISMGQGQEAPAESVVERFAKEGGWVMLQNCHLMQSWVPKLERMLEIVTENAHKDFRCYISAEPPPMASMKNMPESLLQSCIKVANEAPADIKSNLTRAWNTFDSSMIDSCDKPTEFKGCLFVLCWFHSIVLGRRRFGQQGWSRAYSFNTGDLTICGDVLHSYLNSNPTVPWDDLRYVFGEIMYGGHITDPWDRRTNNTYLQVMLEPRIFEGMELAPKFPCPNFAEKGYTEFFDFINTALPPECPPHFGLHPNAEIGYLTNSTNSLFTTIMNDLLERLPDNFEMITLGLKAKPLMEKESGPFVVVAMQECGRMNALTSEIRRSLVELDKGLKGQLNMSGSMEDLVVALSINQWPGRNPFALCAWEKLAWPSRKGLLSQFQDMLLRIEELNKWVEEFVTPLCMWLPGLFNPTAYLTAVMQVTARSRGFALDQMTTETHITTYYDPAGIDFVPDDGVFIHGIYIEGARWPALDELEATEPVGNVSTGGVLTDSRLKELLPLLPVIYVKAVQVQPSWEPSAVGYLRHTPDVYECPVYLTSFRGPTYIFLATMKTEAPTSKWVLTGTAMIMQTDD